MHLAMFERYAPPSANFVTFKTFRSFLVILCHFGAILSHLGPNSKLSQTSHVTTQNDRKRSRNPMEMVSEVNFKMLRSFQDHLGPFEAIIGLFLGLNLKVVVG